MGLIAQKSQASDGSAVVLVIPAKTAELSTRIFGLVGANYGTGALLDSTPSITVTNCVHAPTGATFTALFIQPKEGGGTPVQAQLNRGVVWTPGYAQQLHIKPGATTTITFATGYTALVTATFHALQVHFRYV